jgi:Domain of unknown function (DUF4384)
MFKQCAFLLLVLLGVPEHLCSQNAITPGVQFNDDNYKKIPRRAPIPRRGAKSVPKNASLKTYAPQAGNQADRSTCLAWAMAYAFTIQEARQRGIMQPNAIQQLFYSPAFIYHHIKDVNDANCKNGADLLKAMNAIQQSGVVRYSDLPTDCPTSIPSDLINKAYKGVAPTFNRLFEPNDAQNLNVKKALSEGNPVIIVQKGQNAKEMGHAMCVVGYKDDPVLQNEGYFEVLDSRGSAWQDHGFGKIAYKTFKEQVVYAIEVPPLLELPKIGKPVDSTHFKTKIQFIDAANQKMELKPAVAELVKNRGAGVGKKTKGSHYIATQVVTKDFEYQVLVDNEASAYVYILNFDSRKVVDLLFPLDDFSPYLGKQSSITLPSDEQTIYFDDNKGTDYCCILLSNKVLDMKQLKAKIEAEALKMDATGKAPIFVKCLETVLGEKLVGIGDGAIQYDAKENRLNLNIKTDRNIAAMIIEFEHK